MRGVAYSPTPVGVDPAAQSLDFFSDTYQRIYDRDLPLMAAAGINTVRGPPLSAPHCSPPTPHRQRH